MEETISQDSRVVADGESALSSDSEDGEGEIVIGFVAPTGSDSSKVHRVVTHVLASYGYSHRHHRLSQTFTDPRVAERFGIRTDDSSEYARIKTSMDGGDAIRSLARQAEAMALFACTLIAKCRADASGGENNDTGSPRPMSRTAHIIQSLKRPEEVIYLSRVYGSRFLLISIHTPREQRRLNLRERGLSEVQAVELISRDETGEPRRPGIGSQFAQATSKTFHMADLFLDGSRGDDEMRRALYRFFDLVFGCPLVTPTWEEHSMFLAHAASLRSGDLSRQVGAVITTTDGTVVAEGANDAPKAHGGQYWPGEDDQRDIARGFDSNERTKEQMIISLGRELAARCNVTAKTEGDSTSVDELLRDSLKKSGFLGLTEFGRAVHAEMAALMSCVRRGVQTQGCVLFCTTFPCHNCAKHIVAAGITMVYFIEPYPKSRAIELHSDSLTLVKEQGKVDFSPFIGIGPKRYVELFMLRDAFGNTLSRKGDAGDVVEWQRAGKSPSLPNRLIPYIEQERRAVALLETALVSRTPGRPDAVS